MIRAAFWIMLPVAAVVIGATHARKFNGPPFVVGLIIIGLVIMLATDRRP